MTPMRDPAPKRQQDSDYLEYVESHKCLVCFAPADDAHHIDTKGSGGSDYATIPLCRGHHTEIGEMPDRKFEQKHQLNIWEESHRLLRRYLSDHPIAK